MVHLAVAWEEVDLAGAGMVAVAQAAAVQVVAMVATAVEVVERVLFRTVRIAKIPNSILPHRMWNWDPRPYRPDSRWSRPHSTAAGTTEWEGMAEGTVNETSCTSLRHFSYRLVCYTHYDGFESKCNRSPSLHYPR